MLDVIKMYDDLDNNMEYGYKKTDSSEKDPLERGIELAYKILRHEARPNPEACTKLLTLRADLGDRNPEETSAEREMKTLIDQAINICRSDITRIQQQKKDKPNFF